MKKVFLFAVTAIMMAACSSEELATQGSSQQTGPTGQDPIAFDVYALRSTDTRAGVPGEIDNTNFLSTTTPQGKAGFGVFGYFTNNSDYDNNNSIPNFMYNQQVKYQSANTWVYEPVKYWPNEYGDAAQSDDFDKLSFFAYAPYVEVTPTTGVPITEPSTTVEPVPPTNYPHIVYADKPESEWTALGLTITTDVDAMQAYIDANIKLYNPVDASATPIVYQWTWNEYLVKLNEWHTEYLEWLRSAAAQSQKLNITQLNRNTTTGDPIVKYVVDTRPSSSVDLLWGVASADAARDYIGMDGETQSAGNCFLNLTKQDGVNKKLKWNFKHALAKLNIQIIADVDEITPDGETTTTALASGTTVWLRSITLNGLATRGALNLHSEDVNYTDPATAIAAAYPNWLDYDGSRELIFEGITFYDGLKDGKEGTTNNIQKNESPTGLNHIIIQQDALSTGVPTDAFVNLFDGAQNEEDGIFIIPSDEPMDITIEYDVETEDPSLPGVLADGKTHGISIKNKITKTAVFGPTVNIEPGKFYTVKLYLGLESVKFDAEVTAIIDAGSTDVELPENN